MSITYRPFGEDAEAEFKAIEGLLRQVRRSLASERLDREQRERWHRQNPDAYSFYERGGRLVGLRVMFPIHPDLYWRLRRTDLSADDLHREDLLGPEEAERCRHTGVAYVVTGWAEADEEVSDRMLTDTFEILRSANVEGFYAETGLADLQRFCEQMSLLELPPRARTAEGAPIRAWCADREYAYRARTPLRGIFQQIDAAFRQPVGPAPPCRLSEREKAVAYWYFVKRRTREETAHRLFISPNTVQDHVNAIQQTVEPLLVEPYLPGAGSSDSLRTRIGELLEKYPQLYSASAPARKP